MDVTVTRFQEIYKSRALRFGSSAQPATLAQRLSDLKQQRRNSRHSVMMSKRKIIASALTPIASPAVNGQNNKKKLKQETVQENKKNDRMEMLRKWQEEKRKRMEKQKSTTKPLFKVHHVAESSQFNLEKIYGEIKGKAIGTKSSTYKFKPPANIKPINMNVATTTKFPPTKKKLEVIPTTKRVTRSQKVVAKSPHMQLPNRTRKIGNKNGNNRVIKPENIPNVGTSSETLTTEVNASSPPQPRTPLNKCSGSSVYVSPFVTMSRGKENARKEFQRRSIRGGTDGENNTSPQAAAAYFYSRVNNQTNRFRNLCQEWANYKEKENPVEEVCDMINVAIGQTELLLTKKFEQFKGLIVSCETGNSEKPVTCLDLHGFWDMIMIQVENLNKRFDNLVKLRENGWEEVLPITNKPNQKNKPKNKKATKKSSIKAATSSSLKAIIEEARRKKEADAQEIILVDSGNDKIIKRRSSVRNNLRISTVTAEAKRSIGSPGLTMMKVTQVAKSAEKLMFGTPTNNDNKKSSPKSILKSQKSKAAARRKSKVVLFRENSPSIDQENQENNRNSGNMIDFSPIRAPRRRSMRLAASAKSTPNC